MPKAKQRRSVVIPSIFVTPTADNSGERTAPTQDAATVAQHLLDGDRRALARAITFVENGDAIGGEIVAQLYPHTGHASFLGFTGAPGVGKSSLLGAVIRHLRHDADTRVGVISVDPSSPFTDGALLGDRIRLTEHFLDRNVFIRSMSTRGHLGGLSEATLQTALLLDAFGMDEVLLETVGVGQSEVEISRIADTTVLVLMPGSGDSVQALKAGIMEIPDIIVINKCDHPAAHELRQQIRSVLTLSKREWTPPIVETQALSGQGIDRLWESVREHRNWLGEDSRLEQRRRRSLELEVLSLAAARAAREVRARVDDDPRLRELLEQMHARELDPLTCTTRLFEEVFTS